MAKKTPPTTVSLYNIFNDFYKKIEEYDYKAYHISLYFFIVHKCNNLYWKNPIDLHTAETMSGSGIFSRANYKKILYDLEDWGFIDIVYKSNNQWNANKVILVGIPITNTLPTKTNTTNTNTSIPDASPTTPQKDEVLLYFKEKNSNLGKEFFDRYEKNGWTSSGKNIYMWQRFADTYIENTNNTKKSNTSNNTSENYQNFIQ